MRRRAGERRGGEYRSLSEAPIARALLALLTLALAACEGLPSLPGDGAADAATATASTASDLERYLADAPERPLDMPASDAVRTEVRRFYARRDHRPAWLDAEGLDAAEGLIDALHGSVRHGLEPRAYAVEALQRRLADVRAGRGGRRDALALEHALTWAALSYAEHLVHGRVRAEEVDAAWYIAPRSRDTAAVLERGLGEGDLDAALDALAPDLAEYRQLQDALARYRSYAAIGFTEVPESDVVEMGEEVDPAVLDAIEARLADEGYLERSRTRFAAEPPRIGPATYDDRLAGAVRAFQADHGIAVDGLLGPATRRELAVPAEVREAQIARNLERWRWMPDDLGAEHVRVNLPAYRLELLRDGVVADHMKVAIGKEGWNTPIFSDAIELVVINPYWNVPESIALEDILPRVQRDPGWLEANDFELVTSWGPYAEVIDASTIDWDAVEDDFPHRLRQRPGPHNALGRVKFRFPNRFAIYLHDTPSEDLFERTDRGVSHGCVRVERPFDLADELLADWSREEIMTAVDSGERDVIHLDDPVPVYLTYFTAEVDADGDISFHQDIYGVDAAHVEALGEAHDAWSQPSEEGAAPDDADGERPTG